MNQSKMRPISSHSALLAKALFGIGGQNIKLYDASSYLQLAAGIKTVEFDTFQFDPTPGMCAGADQFQEERDSLFSSLVTRLSIFLFAWAAIEAYKERLPLASPKKAPGDPKRKIDKLCHYLTTSYTQPLPDGYLGVLQSLKSVVVESDICRDAGKTTTFPSFVGKSAEGLYLVYEFRNAFAHGDFSAPFPEGEPTEHPDVLVVAIATRLVLMTLQMITLCYYSPNDNVDLPTRGLFADGDRTISVRETFLNLHLLAFDTMYSDAD
jgi:hypothetical protein